MTRRKDFTLYTDGPWPSVYLLIPHTAAARAWCDEHLPLNAPMLGSGIAIEHRYVDDIVLGIEAEPLTVGRIQA